MRLFDALRRKNIAVPVSQAAEVTERWLCRNDIPDELDCDGLDERRFPRLSFSEYDTYITFTGAPMSFTVMDRGMFNTFRIGDKARITYVPLTQEIQGRPVLFGYKLLKAEKEE